MQESLVLKYFAFTMLKFLHTHTHFTMNLLKEFWMMIFFCQHGAKSLLVISLRGAEQRKQLTLLLGKSLGRKEQVTTFTRADGYISAGVSPR